MSLSQRRYIPKTTIQAWRLDAYKRAYQERRKLDPDLSFAAWIRMALDERAELDLDEPLHPPGRRRIVRT